MRISKDVVLLYKAVQIGTTLCFSDVHIGIEESINRQGILLPRTDFKETINELKSLLKIPKKLETIVINGDLKHEFGTISSQEWVQTIQFLECCLAYAKKVIIIKGNHDAILRPIANKKGIEIQQNVVIDSTLYIHGDKIPDNQLIKKVKRIIIGHKHPAISIQDGPRKELYKCFLVGVWNKKELIVLPSFNALKEGNDIRAKNHLSPFLSKGVSKFKIYIVADSIYAFGYVHDL